MVIFWANSTRNERIRTDTYRKKTKIENLCAAKLLGDFLLFRRLPFSPVRCAWPKTCQYISPWYVWRYPCLPVATGGAQLIFGIEPTLRANFESCALEGLNDSSGHMFMNSFASWCFWWKKRRRVRFRGLLASAGHPHCRDHRELPPIAEGRETSLRGDQDGVADEKTSSASFSPSFEARTKLTQTNNHSKRQHWTQFLHSWVRWCRPDLAFQNAMWDQRRLAFLRHLGPNAPEILMALSSAPCRKRL